MGDLIDREDLIDWLTSRIIMLKGIYGDLGGAVSGVREMVKVMPSAEPERKNGRWTGDCCSSCGVSKYNYIKMVDDECGPFGTWNFCPKCGADMRGDHE